MHAVENISPSNHKDHINFVFVNHSEEMTNYPFAVREIADAQTMDKILDKLTMLEKYKLQLVEDIQVLCKDIKLVIPKELQQMR